ncbi:hypothetical protein D3C75_1180820 [compost metagenome]
MYPDADMTDFSELNRIVDQIGQNLRQAQWVAHITARHQRGYLQAQTDSLFSSPLAYQAKHLIQQLRKVEMHVFHAQLASFDL